MAIAAEPVVEYVTLSCPIGGCEWTVSAPRLADRPSAYVTALCALEVLSHVVGRYGAEGRTPHTPEEIDQAGLDAILQAALGTPNPLDEGLLLLVGVLTHHDKLKDDISDDDWCVDGAAAELFVKAHGIR